MTSPALHILADQVDSLTEECRRLAEENDALWTAYDLAAGHPYLHLEKSVPDPVIPGLWRTEGDVRWSMETNAAQDRLRDAFRARREAGLSIWCESEQYRAAEAKGKRKKRVDRPVVLPSLRIAVFERDAYRCVACGSYLKLRLDHIVPFSRGGPTVLANLQTLCEAHNIAKGTLMPTQWAPEWERIRAEAGLPFDPRSDIARLTDALNAWPAQAKAEDQEAS